MWTGWSTDVSTVRARRTTRPSGPGSFSVCSSLSGPTGSSLVSVAELMEECSCSCCCLLTCFLHESPRRNRSCCSGSCSFSQLLLQELPPAVSSPGCLNRLLVSCPSLCRRRPPRASLLLLQSSSAHWAASQQPPPHLRSWTPAPAWTAAAA